MSNLNINPPIVDTDVWVFLTMSGFYKRLIDYYGYLQFSDVVEKEIMRWQSNEGNSKDIALNFQNLKKKNKVRIIIFDDFEKNEQQSINHQLNEYGLKEVRIREKNKGEFTSLLYALHKGIQRFKTNDRKFVTEIGETMQDDITIINWDEIIEKYSVSLKEKNEIRKLIKIKEIEMNKQKKLHQKQSQDPRWEKLKLLMG